MVSLPPMFYWNLNCHMWYKEMESIPYLLCWSWQPYQQPFSHCGHGRLGLKPRHDLFAHVRVLWMQKMLMCPWHKITWFRTLRLLIRPLSCEVTSERPARCPISQTYPWHGFKALKALQDCGFMSQSLFCLQVRSNMLSVLTDVKQRLTQLLSNK